MRSMVDTDPGRSAWDYFLAGLGFIHLPQRFVSHPNPAQADAEALYSDWRAIGEDLWAVMREADEQEKQTQPDRH